jgi:acetyl-CoA carboxylase biotin carboxylase subunit
MFRRILIANRGEIALRIIRACRELGVQTVAVHSTADASSLHVRLADQAVCIGPAAAAESYLNIPRILAAAEITGADAIHPGYGFLSENAHFAEICEKCGLAFIGPTPKNLREMGDKACARDTMRAAGVPVTPGSPGVVRSLDEAYAIAREIGYPLLVKAVAGGGGRGMRVADDDEGLRTAFETAGAEAAAAFGNGDLYIERLVTNARHVEVQVLADLHGNAWHLGERDCSLQRRHQKLIEESPAPALSPDARAALHEAALRAVKAAGLANAATIEFLYDEERNVFYFMEANTRIQVEHPVTEEVSGFDLVQAQIRAAAGEELALSQERLAPKGHAIEVRINAENPHRGFIPCPGLVKSIHFPGGPGIRVDSHVYPGYEISPYYDSLIGKIIARGDTRAEAILRMQCALSEFSIDGPETTVSLAQALIADARFAKGVYNTHFVDAFMEDVFSA